MPRWLFVGMEARWLRLVEQAASLQSVAFEAVQDVQAALTHMLRPDRVYSHVLACCPLLARDVDALAGMLDEVTLRATPLIVLGERFTGAGVVECVIEPAMDALLRALSRVDGQGASAPLSAVALTRALHEGSVCMRFQPIVRGTDLQPIGIEALARLHTREHGIIHPKDFIPATIASGRERVLTGIVAARTFLDMKNMVCRPELFVTINLPLVSLLHPTALARGVELCAVAGVSPSRIMIEVLESRTAPDMDLLGQALALWRQAGFMMAIDDAGPALPHWRELLKLPFDAVKLDGDLIADPASQALLDSIVGAAKDRGRFIIAEGIEDEACLQRIRPFEPDALQGFLFARPLPAMALPLWLAEWGGRDTASRSGLAA